jgi:hypothetical protein
MHLKPTAECQISILIFENKLWRESLGLRCIIPPRHLSQLKIQAIPLTWQKVSKNFAVLDILFMGYL